MRLLVSFAALFMSIILLQLSSGGVGSFDAIVGQTLGFTTGQIGLLGSAHFVGFFIGCWWAPRVISGVGPSRAFASFAALGAIGLLGHTLITHPLAWAVLRIASGLCIAACYTVIEAWLQSKVTNETRGRAMGIYRMVDIGGSLMAQVMIGALASVETYVAYNLLTLFCCASLLPLALTSTKPPETSRAPRLNPVLALTRSPLAVAGVTVAGISTASYRMMGPVYGANIGLTASEIGVFLALFVAGGALAQLPVGYLADKFDRRNILLVTSFMSVGACFFSASVSGDTMVFVASFLFGFVTFPIFSIAAAHAHDFAASDERVELSAALIFYYAVGAIMAPLISARVIDTFGPPAFFILIGAAHIALAIFGLLRIFKGRKAGQKTAYVYAPRTSFIIGRLMRRLRDR